MSSSRDRRRLPILRGISRSSTGLLMGGDRELVIVLGVICAALTLTSMNAPSIIAGIGLWLLGMFVLRRMGKKDPLLRKIYMRHIRYAPYYGARDDVRIQGD